MGIKDKYLKCADGRVFKILHTPRPYVRVHTEYADGAILVKEYGQQLESCDNDKQRN